MKHLIVSADDFGLNKNINEGVVKAYEEGIVTCVNLMPTGEAFDSALKLAKMADINEIGAHLALTQTNPITETRRIPTLVTDNGSFYLNYKYFIFKFIRGLIDLDQVYTELNNQMSTLHRTGLKITNLSSHENLHMVPAILDIFVKLAREYCIPAIRFPHKDRVFHIGINILYKRIILVCFENGMKKVLETSAICTPEHFRGFIYAGKLKEEVVLRILESMEEGTTELVCHPGIMELDISGKYKFYKNCELELSALTSDTVKKLIKDKKIQLLSYGEFLLKKQR